MFAQAVYAPTYPPHVFPAIRAGRNIIGRVARGAANVARRGLNLVRRIAGGGQGRN